MNTHNDIQSIGRALRQRELHVSVIIPCKSMLAGMSGPTGNIVHCQEDGETYIYDSKTYVKLDRPTMQAFPINLGKLGLKQFDLQPNTKKHFISIDTFGGKEHYVFYTVNESELEQYTAGSFRFMMVHIPVFTNVTRTIP